jgi:hypothetical protein
MTLEYTGRWTRAAAGAVLLLLAGACADAPSAPPLATRNAPRVELPAATAAAEGAVTARAFSRASRRIVRQADGSLLKIETLAARDGRTYVVESALDVNGLPRELRVSRDGQLIARVNNDWSEHVTGFALARQRVARFAEDGSMREFDSQAHGGIARMVGADIVVRKGVALAAINAAGDLRRSGLRSYWGGDDFGDWPLTGPCDDKARATDAALDNWVGSMLLLGAAMVSGNPALTFSAGVYEVKAWRDFTRADEALDQCVADAGKKREDDF